MQQTSRHQQFRRPDDAFLPEPAGDLREGEGSLATGDGAEGQGCRRRQQEIRQHERRLNDIRQDQDRLRENLKELPPTSEAYKRYVKKFDDQETEIEQLQETDQEAAGTEFQQRKEFEDYLAG